MSSIKRSDLQYFDPDTDSTMVWRKLPHLAQAGTLCFITLRTADSLPEDVVERMTKQREQLLRRHHIEPGEGWKASLAQLKPDVRAGVYWAIFKAWDNELDTSCGACVLRNPELSQIVMNSLLHFDNERYFLTDAVTMPNHVHLIAAFRDEESLLTQCTSWKHYTATRINRWLWKNNANSADGAAELRMVAAPSARPKTEFWQTDQFDHLIRNEVDFDRYRKYIAENPAAAKLRDGEYRYYCKSM